MTEPCDERPDPNREWWTSHEVADLFRVTVDTVYRWIKSGKLPATRISRNLYRIRAEDARELEAKELEGASRWEYRTPAARVPTAEEDPSEG